MRSAGSLTDADLAELDAAVTREIDDAVTVAETAPFEPVAELTRFVYSEASHG
jgi:pyruvate dehydrogenase E1 component alpha subunit